MAKLYANTGHTPWYLGAQIRLWRRRRGLSQPQLAAQVGTSRRAMNQLENDRFHRYDKALLCAVAAVLQTTLEQLFREPTTVHAALLVEGDMDEIMRLAGKLTSEKRVAVIGVLQALVGEPEIPRRSPHHRTAGRGSQVPAEVACLVSGL